MLSLKYLSAIFYVHVMMAIPINRKHHISQNGTFKQTVEPIAACLFVLMKLHMEGPMSALPV